MKKQHGTAITAIGFDLGGVVITGNQPRLYRFLAATLGCDTYALATAVAHYKPQLESGTIELDEFWGLLSSSLHVAKPAQELQEELWTHGFLEQTVVRQEVLDLVERLRQNGYKIGMFTNISHQFDLVDQKRGVFEHFDVVLKSYEVGFVKPQKEAFEALAEALETPMSEIVFIDDIGMNIDGAVAAGMQGIQYGDLEQVTAALQALGVKTDA